MATSGEPLLIFGASARAAAFSALRADLRPWCADLFADRDLEARCPSVRLAAEDYPDGILPVAIAGPRGPWMYTGGLENRRSLVRKIAQHRKLWGNDATILRSARDPISLYSTLQQAGVPCPAIHLNPADLPQGRTWLVKSRAGAGGTGIHFWGKPPLPHSARGSSNRGVYYQEYIEGESYAAIYVATAAGTQLLGFTRQLVGEEWLHAAPFHYCGSIYLPMPSALQAPLECLGAALAQAWGLRGLFGVDFVLRDGIPWPVEVNPRYTASIEVLEYAQGTPALALHRAAFLTPLSPVLGGAPWATGMGGQSVPGPTPSPPTPLPRVRGRGEQVSVTPSIVGKAILYARTALTFPQAGPWLGVLDRPAPVTEMPAFADIPRAGEPISAGRPILTFFARATTGPECLASLRHIAADLDRFLFDT